jgi:hypothetical protein
LLKLVPGEDFISSLRMLQLDLTTLSGPELTNWKIDLSKSSKNYLSLICDLPELKFGGDGLMSILLGQEYTLAQFTRQKVKSDLESILLVCDEKLSLTNELLEIKEKLAKGWSLFYYIMLKCVDFVL